MNTSVPIQYDYIIVGGGTAGCVLASRLSEDPNLQILLCEAGIDVVPNAEPADVLDMYPGTAYLNKSYIWKDLKVSTQAPVSGRGAKTPAARRFYEQARILGGGSSINGQMANRGAPTDYDEWDSLGATGWSWDEVLPFFRKLERDVHFKGPLHGSDGPIAISRILPENWPPHAEAVANAFKESGYPYLPDQNGEFCDGYYPIAIANLNGKRITAATAYLNNEVRSRPNLHIRTELHVSALVMTGKVCAGIELHTKTGATEKIGAKQVILSAGAIHSPAMLMRAGIGPADTLRALNIPVTADRPGVGQRLMDHPGVALASYIKREARIEGYTKRHMILSLRYSSETPGTAAGDMCVLSVSKSAWHPVGEQIGSLLVFVNQTFSSTGRVTLGSADWREPPVVDFNLLSDPRDLSRLMDGFRRIAKLQTSAVMRDVCSDAFPASYNDKVKQVGEINDWNRYRTWLAAKISDLHPAIRRRFYERFVLGDFSLTQLLSEPDALERFVRRDAIGLWHASCTCRMGSANDPLAVTSPTGQVYGVEGLRVVDASIFPKIPCANTNVPTIMAAEKIAASILNEKH